MGSLPARRVYFLVAAFVAGAAVLGLEVLAARTMAPAIGTGSIAWAALLAVALGSLAAGNLVSGFLADRVRPHLAVLWLMTAGAAPLVALSLCYTPAMHWAAGHSLVIAAVAAAALTQCVPMLLLGAITPLLLAPEREGTGTLPLPGWWSGAVLAGGSAGGIAGALVVGLSLLPAVGLARTYLLIAAALTVAALVGAGAFRRWTALAFALAILVAALICWVLIGSPSVVQSRYGQIEVRRTEDGTVMLIDGMPQTGIVGQVERGDGLRHGYLLEAALVFGQPRTALVIGLGGGLAPRLLAAYGIPCRSIEIDPAVAEIARRELGFEGDVTIADGRTFLSSTREQWDLIVLDVCTSDRLAWHVFTVEGLQTLHDHLTPQGAAAIQFIGDDGSWSAALARTAQAAFGRFVMLAPNTPSFGVGPRWIFASRDPSIVPEAEHLEVEEGLPWRLVKPEAGGPPLTDDHLAAEHAWARTAAAWRRVYAEP